MNYVASLHPEGGFAGVLITAPNKSGHNTDRERESIAPIKAMAFGPGALSFTPTEPTWKRAGYLKLISNGIGIAPLRMISRQTACVALRTIQWAGSLMKPLLITAIRLLQKVA